MLAVLAVGMPAVPAFARGQTHHVQAWSNFFFPNEIRISPGDTIVWTAMNEGHTVTAEDNRFTWPPVTGVMKRGETFSWTFNGDETLAFYCRVHGQFGGPKPGSYNMLGKIIAGTGGTRPSPPPGQPQVRDVPLQYPTIRAALVGIPANSTVRIAPGVYADVPGQDDLAQSTATITVPGITIDGGGAVLDGTGARPSGLIVAADGVTIRNLTVRGYRIEGIAVRSAGGFTASGVVAQGGGIVVSDSTGAKLTDVTARGAPLAGIMIKNCIACATTIDSATVEGNLYGVLVDNADGVTIRGSVVRNNGTGIVARSVATDRQTLGRGVIIESNDISSNNAVVPAAGLMDFAVRSGVWFAGGLNGIVRGNRFDGHDYGVLVAAWGMPAVGVRVEGNVLSTSSRADLGFDGAGVNVCFAGNTGPSGSPASSLPAFAPTFYDCALPATVGIAEPAVIADVAGYALTGTT